MLKKLLTEFGNRLLRPRARESAPGAGVSHPDPQENNQGARAGELAEQDDPMECNQMGQRYRNSGAHTKARACFERAIALDPDFVAARFNLGNLLFGANSIDAAAAQYQSILALQPDNPDVQNNQGMILLQSGQAAEAVTLFRSVLEKHPEFDTAGNNLLLALTLAPGHTPAELLAEHVRYAKRKQNLRSAGGADWQNRRDPQRRLRIGYVSGDFKNHPVAWFMAQILTHHDAKRFEIFCYSNWYKADAVTNAIKQCAHAWRQIDELTDGAVAELVRQDGIDILVDLSGHSNGGRLGVFALKPAPVQMTYLGYANTTGLTAIDYRITDAYGDPPEISDAYYVEKLIRMPACMWCYTPHQNMPDVGGVSATSSGHVTFGSFNNAAKINSGLTALWSRLLRAVPESRLVIACLPEGSTRERLHGEFAAHGVEVSRVELLGRLPMREFWRLHQRVDIALDSFPCNGGTTTCDTLWMGVPVVSWCGERFASRAGYSILTNIGLDELVAHDADEYVAVATALAHDRDRLASLHAGLRERLAASPLLDITRFTHDLEIAYRTAWETWVDGRPAAPLQIVASSPPQAGKAT